MKIQMQMNKDSFLGDIKDFISKSVKIDSKGTNTLNCNNCFRCNDNYAEEKQIIEDLKNKKFKTSKEQGDCLEILLKKMFKRIELISSFNVTNKDTSLGQIDIILNPIDDTIYDILGLTSDHPNCLIGECKNYKSDGVSREEIEKTCWRSAKGKALSFFIARSYKKTAVDEIMEFNRYRNNILSTYEGVYIIPITIDMLETVISEHINFCYFIRWAIQSSKTIMSINNYL
jgi:hypothetical protein